VGINKFLIIKSLSFSSEVLHKSVLLWCRLQDGLVNIALSCFTTIASFCADCRLQRGLARAERPVATWIHVGDTGKHLSVPTQRPQHYLRTGHWKTVASTCSRKRRLGPRLTATQVQTTCKW